METDRGTERKNNERDLLLVHLHGLVDRKRGIVQRRHAIDCGAFGVTRVYREPFPEVSIE